MSTLLPTKIIGYLLRWHFPQVREFWYRDIPEIKIHKGSVTATFDNTHQCNRDFLLPRVAMQYWWTRSEANADVHEPTVLRRLLRTMTADSTFFDVGANIGYFSAFAAEKIEVGSVHTFEIQPKMVEAMQRHPSLINNEVHVNKVAVAEGTGKQLSFGRHISDYPATNTLLQAGSGTIETTTLDRYCNNFDVSPEIIKIDVEGFEYKVVKGSRGLLEASTIKHLFIEIHPELISESAHRGIFNLVEECGFDVTVIDSKDDLEIEESPPVFQERPYFVHCARRPRNRT
jgi:FkbM family methyltransferase